MKDKFTADDTKVIKGVAIVLMLMHHLWSFSDRIAGGELKSFITYSGVPLVEFLGDFGKICVSLFFFLGGYGIYVSSKKKEIDVIAKVKALFVQYWKVFLIFIPIAFIFFRNQPYYCDDIEIFTAYNHFNLTEFIQNFLGLGHSYNREWWFLRSYVIAILTFPLLKKVCDKYSSTTNIFLVILFSILVTNFFPAIGKLEVLGYLNNNLLYGTFFCQTAPFIASFWMGMVFAKDDLIVKLKNQINNNVKLNFIVDLIIIAVVVYLRQKELGNTLDIIYIPFFIIAALDLLEKIPCIKKILYNFGKQSTNMWLTHTFYCYYFYFFVQMVVKFEWAVPCLVVLLFLTYYGSVLLDFIWKVIGYFYDKAKALFNDIKEHFKSNDLQKNK